MSRFLVTKKQLDRTGEYPLRSVFLDAKRSRHMVRASLSINEDRIIMRTNAVTNLIKFNRIKKLYIIEVALNRLMDPIEWEVEYEGKLSSDTYAFRIV